MGLSGGMLVGAVFDYEGEPQEDSQVAITEPDGDESVGTTDSSGHYAISIGTALGTAQIALPGNDPELVEQGPVEVVEQVPDGLSESLPEFVSVGETTMLGHPYRSASVTGADWPETELPIAMAIAPDGASGLSSFIIPAQLGAGPLTISLQGFDGEMIEEQVTGYRYVSASIERDKLMSGDLASFQYELDFGTGPRLVYITVVTAGPISYARNGVTQPLEIGADGKAIFVDQIQALQGSPTGIPFSISATFTEAETPDLEM